MHTTGFPDIDYKMMEPLWQIASYVPSPEQRRVHESLLVEGSSPDGSPVPRLVVLGGGIQSGKSFLAGYHAFGRFPSDKITWIVGAEYRDCKHEWAYARDAAVKAQATYSYSKGQDGPWELVYKDGGSLSVLPSKDITKLAGEAPDLIVMAEAGRQTYEAFETCLDRVTPKHGVLLVSGTFEEGANWYRNLWKECRSSGNVRGGTALSLPSYSNRVFYPSGAQDPKFLARRTQMLATRPIDGADRFAERFLGEPRTPTDLVFKDFARKVHVQEWADFDPGEGVALWIDPGFDPSAFAILFVQLRGDTICVFDEMYLLRTLNEQIISMVKNHYSFPNLQRIVMDKAAKQHGNAQEAAIETWQSAFRDRDIPVVPSSSTLSIPSGIARTHDKLGLNPDQTPRLVMHPRVRMLSWEMEEGYKFRMREDGYVHSDNPIDENNHACKALAYGIVDAYGLSSIPPVRLPDPVITPSAAVRSFTTRQSSYYSRAGRR